MPCCLEALTRDLTSSDDWLHDGRELEEEIITVSRKAEESAIAADKLTNEVRGNEVLKRTLFKDWTHVLYFSHDAYFVSRWKSYPTGRGYWQRLCSMQGKTKRYLKKGETWSYQRIMLNVPYDWSLF